jgi:O-antigen/teichoic acid export membrane protein
MPDGFDDPTDHARTTLPRAGEAMKDSRSLGGYGLLGLAVLALVICLAAAAVEVMGWALGAGVVAVLCAAVGSGWVYRRRRRIAHIARSNASER